MCIYILYICENWFHWNLELFLSWEILSVHCENWFHWNFGLFSGAIKNVRSVWEVLFSQNQAMEHRFASQFVCPKIPTSPKIPRRSNSQKSQKFSVAFRRERKFAASKKRRFRWWWWRFRWWITQKSSENTAWFMYVCIRCLEKVTKISLPNLGLIWWCTVVERKNNRKHTKGIGVVVFLLLSKKN